MKQGKFAGEIWAATIPSSPWYFPRAASDMICPCQVPVAARMLLSEAVLCSSTVWVMGTQVLLLESCPDS